MHSHSAGLDCVASRVWVPEAQRMASTGLSGASSVHGVSMGTAGEAGVLAEAR